MTTSLFHHIPFRHPKIRPKIRPKAPPMPGLPDSYDHHLAAVGVGDRALPHCRRWASLWQKADGPASPDRTSAFFDALGRSTGIADCQFRQAFQAVRILSTDSLAFVLVLPLLLPLNLVLPSPSQRTLLSDLSRVRRR